MTFTGEQLTAIIKMAKAMVMADGRVEKSEIQVMTTELLRFNVPQDHVPHLLTLADKMDASKALAIIANFDDEAKKYVASYLGVIMASDGDIDDREMSLWRLVSTLCGLPTMNVVDAITNMRNL